MRKIGSTSTGSVIIEMTAAQYAALTQVMGPKSGVDESEEKKPANRPVMAVHRKQGYIRNCLNQLRPENRQEVFRSIRSMFHGSGGIRDTEVDQMIDYLIKDGYFRIDAHDRVTYADEKDKVLSILQEENRSQVKGDAETEYSGVGPEDEESLEDAFSPALLAEVAEGDNPIDEDQRVEQLQKFAHE